jgi:hypothetical protein
MSVTNADVVEVILTDLSGKDHYLTSSNSSKSPEAQIDYINIYESIERNSILAEMKVIDTITNLISTAPIVGTEEVTIKVKTPATDSNTYTYKFVVYAIRNRAVSLNYQEYILDLFTPEALINETIRVGKVLQGQANSLVKKDLIQGFLGSNKDVDDEATKFPIKVIPSLKRPFDIISQLAPGCVSSNFNPIPEPLPSATNPGSGSKKEGQTSGVTSKTADGVISGSAGYFFYETYKGYTFKSIDTIITGDSPHPEYTYTTQQDGAVGSAENPYVILDYSFLSQENILKKMRHGTYSSMISFFNPATLDYEEYFFDLSKEYPNMKHLGTEESIPESIKALSEYPSRVMLQFYDHETYYTGADIADPNSANGGTSYPDYRKQWLAQSISRNTLLNNQSLNIVVPCNLKLRAGDKLKISLPNQSVQSLRSGGNSVDVNNSGVYLIKSISYEIRRDAKKAVVAVSNIVLIRDNLGS